jgi:hypothetical protein
MTTYLDRALEAANSARQVQAVGDHNGVCNRADYVVFYAAQGLLEPGRGQESGENPRVPASQIFRAAGSNRHGQRSADLGGAVAQNLRSKADYSLAGASETDANDAIAAMERVLSYARPRLEWRESGSRS